MIKILEKPDNITWDRIHEVLWAGHARNRDNGIIMSFPSLSGDELQKKIEDGNGKLFVAFDDDEVIGTAGFTIRTSHTWYNKGRFAYFCLAAVIPAYTGQGVYKKLYDAREAECKRIGIKLFVMETHIHNRRIIKILKRQGFAKVGIKCCSDNHRNVIMAKWTERRPFSPISIWLHYNKARFKLFLKHLPKK